MIGIAVWIWNRCAGGGGGIPFTKYILTRAGEAIVTTSGDYINWR